MRPCTVPLIASLCSIAGCGDDGSDKVVDAAPMMDAMVGSDGMSSFDLAVTVSGYGQQENGNIIYFALYESGGSTAVATETLTTVSEATVKFG